MTEPTPVGAASRRDTAPDAVTPPPGNPRFPLLDPIRGIAVLLIVLFHVSFYSGVWLTTWWGRDIASQLQIAVPIFFSLSAFLLYRPFIAERVGGRRPGVAGYAWRRALRILPAYWVVIALSAFYYGTAATTFGSDWWVYFGLLGNYAPLYDPGALCGEAVCTSIYWSLGTELLFYAVLPLYVFGMDRLTGKAGSRWLPVNLTVLLGVGLASVAIGVGIRGRPDASWLIYTLATNAIYFAVGMALAGFSVETSGGRLSAMRNWVERHPGLLWTAAAAVFGLLCGFFSVGDPVTTARATIGPLLRALFVLLLLTPAIFPGEVRALPQRVLGNRLLAWVGLVSYAVYLWHVVVIDFLHKEFNLIGHSPTYQFAALALPALIASVTIGAASYYLLERPILRLKLKPAWARRDA